SARYSSGGAGSRPQPTFQTSYHHGSIVTCIMVVTAVIVAPRPPASERDQSGAVPPGPGHLRKGHHDNVMPVDLIAPRDVSDALLGIRQGPLRRPVSTTMSRGVDHDRTR